MNALARQLLPALLSCACSGAATAPRALAEAPPPDAPVVAAQPGAWFDSEGNLMVVGAGRRLRITLSAPIAACTPAFQSASSPAQAAEHAALPFRILGDICRSEHPTILLPEESETASPAELERSYHEVARCVSHDLGATSGWVPDVVAARDPCPLALGLGWRLPKVAELHGLGVDDRKAVAGALYDTEDRAGFGSLLLYAQDAEQGLKLVTLSPNAAEQAPTLGEAARAKPFFGAALRCVRDGAPPAGVRPAPPPLPEAPACVRALRAEQHSLHAAPAAPNLPELDKLKAWVALVQKAPATLQSDASLRDLMALLSAPALTQLAQDAREERALTEHYAELAESLDDPNVSEGERARRRAEFDTLRKRLGGKIVASATAGGAQRTELHALLAHIAQLLESAAAQSKPSKKPKTRPPDYAPALARLRELSGEKAKAP